MAIPQEWTHLVYDEQSHISNWPECPEKQSWILTPPQSSHGPGDTTSVPFGLGLHDSFILIEVFAYDSHSPQLYFHFLTVILKVISILFNEVTLNVKIYSVLWELYVLYNLHLYIFAQPYYTYIIVHA